MKRAQHIYVLVQFYLVKEKSEQYMNMKKISKIGFIGAGQMAQAIIRALLDSKTFVADQIYISNRSNDRLQKVAEKFKVNPCSSNEKLVESVDVVILATKPQDLAAAIEPVGMAFNEGQIVLSLAAGITLDKLEEMIPSTKLFGRVMPNTPIKVQKGVVGYTLSEECEVYDDDILKILNPLGLVVPLYDGEAFQAFTVAAASGPGFLFELMQYWQDWIEGYGIEPEVAKKIVTQTFLGTALLAERQDQMSFEDLQSQVTSKKGVTFAGLESMRELEIERLLRLSLEKSILRDTELSKLS